jgi:Fe-S cluster biogenesis protein NfuA/nitrite reductase/ring-hydroxylating ferredoxin subunit
MAEDKEAKRLIERIERLIAEIDTIADPNVRASAVSLVQSLLELQGNGINRILEIVADSSHTGEALIDELGRDDLVGSLLTLHGLHPLDIHSRVTQALEKVRPYLKSHGGDVQLLDISETGNVHLRLVGSCKTCPSSTVTMKLAVEEAIYAAAPDVTAITEEGTAGLESRSNLVQISVNGDSAKPKNGWESVEGLDSLAQSSIRALDIGGRPVLFCRLGDSLYAYGDRCPRCSQTLQDAQLETTSLACLNCGQHYDVIQAGRGLDDPTIHLEPFPLLVDRGEIKVALPPQLQPQGEVGTLSINR